MATKNATKTKSAAKKAPASAKTQAKDLPAKKNVKGGLRGDGWSSTNHHETLV